MDLDVLAGSVSTLRKNGYRILEDLAFRRSLQPFGIADIIMSDPDKAKHTNTTQRFNLHLVNIAGESYPTKVEFSRRTSEDEYVLEPIDPKVARFSRNLSFPCQHYTPLSMVSQKLYDRQRNQREFADALQDRINGLENDPAHRTMFHKEMDWQFLK